MSTRQPIFAQTAPAYYARNLPVIPLYPQDKKPMPMDWSRYHDQPVEDNIQQQWLNGHADSNIGIVLGAQSGIVALDIDAVDEKIIRVITGLLPPSPWVRIGAKGMVMAYKFNGTATFRIKNTDGQTICEHLSSRTQVVLPPSIHPSTKRPYTANVELLSVIDSLPILDDNIEAILRAALSEAGCELSHSGWTKTLDFASAGSRDTSLTERAGLFAYAVLRGDRTLKEAIGMLRSYATEFVENVAGDPVDVEKHVSNLIKFLHRDVIDKQKALPVGWDADMTPEEKKAYGLEFEKDHEEWSYEYIVDYLKDEFERFPKESPQRVLSIDKALAKIAASKTLNRLEEDRLFDYIASAGQLGMKVASLKARVKDLRKGTLKGEDQSELARALIADLELIHPVRHHNGMVWKWAGSHWETMDDQILMAKISTEFGHLQACRKHSDMKGILNVMKMLLPQGIKSVEVKGVNFANGFLTENLSLLTHDPQFGMTYTLPFRYLPEQATNAPMFFEFLARSWGEDPDYQEKVHALQEALCVTLFAVAPRYQRAILLQGAPKSGKSQLLKIASALVPDSARCAVPPDMWSDKFIPTTMNEKLLNVAGELSEKKLIDGQKFKDIIDGSEMSGQMKGGQIFVFKPVCAHWFAGNHYPKTDDTSEGFNRRWLMLQFSRPVPPEERKLDFGDTVVANEREGIVAWAVQAMTRLKAKNEYTIPESHKQMIREVANLNNSVRFFLTESGKVRTANLQLVSSAGEKTSNLMSVEESKIYGAYWSFCIGPASVRPVGSTQFRAKMRELGTEFGFKIMIKNTPQGAQEVVYENITLISPAATSQSNSPLSGKTPMTA
ncbi:DNA primase [Achromobacter phage 2-1]|nr:DNA primase [Achromobacter phage 2-1]